MNPSEIGTPPSVEAGPPSASPDPSKQGPQQDPHYRSSEEECFQCAHFQDPNVCNLGVNGGQTEPGAGCDLYELKSDHDGDEGGPPTSGQGAPPPSSPSMLPQGGGQ